MALVLFYMTGNNIQIITILVTMGMVIPQVRALFHVNVTFKPLEDPQTKDQIVMCKIIYAGLHVAILAAAIYKFSCEKFFVRRLEPKQKILAMGLIPVRPIDWLSLVNYVQVFFHFLLRIFGQQTKNRSQITFLSRSKNNA